MKKPRIYISGPISGTDIEKTREKFKMIQLMLEEQGYETFNPMENGLPAESTTNEHMHRDLAELTKEGSGRYDAIYMMRRWTHSKGCKVEFDVATAIGLTVYFEETGRFIKFE